MTCQKIEIMKGGAYPRSCPECGLVGKCKYIGNNDGSTFTVTVGNGVPIPNAITYVAQTNFVDGGAQPVVPVRVVVCAANRYNFTGNVIIGVRHFDTHMQKALTSEDAGDPCEQGFIDQHGVFMNRTEALAVAKAAGQINVRRPKTYPLDKLFSEDIY